jgi:hypothetical protein
MYSHVRSSPRVFPSSRRLSKPPVAVSRSPVAICLSVCRASTRSAASYGIHYAPYSRAQQSSNRQKLSPWSLMRRNGDLCGRYCDKSLQYRQPNAGDTWRTRKRRRDGPRGSIFPDRQMIYSRASLAIYGRKRIQLCRLWRVRSAHSDHVGHRYCSTGRRSFVCLSVNITRTKIARYGVVPRSFMEYVRSKFLRFVSSETLSDENSSFNRKRTIVSAGADVMRPCFVHRTCFEPYPS